MGEEQRARHERSQERARASFSASSLGHNKGFLLQVLKDASHHRPHRREARNMLGGLQRFLRLWIPPDPIVVDLAKLERALVRSQLVHPVGHDLRIVNEDVALLRVVPALRVSSERVRSAVHRERASEEAHWFPLPTIAHVPSMLMNLTCARD